jgi:hypothetical protein
LNLARKRTDRTPRTIRRRGQFYELDSEEFCPSVESCLIPLTAS